MVQIIEVAGIGSVTIYRRKGMRTIRISVGQNGVTRLSLPHSVSLKKGLDFLQTKQGWVVKHSTEPISLDDGSPLGKNAVLKLHTGTGTKIKSVRKPGQLHVYIPEDMNYVDVQAKLQKSAKKLLIEQSEQLLLPRLSAYAGAGGYKINNINIKLLKSRWGSCSNFNDIVLNGYLVQLPWEYIDYVIWHELSHSVHHNHSTNFWNELSKHVPNYKKIRVALKKYPTAVFDWREFSTVV